MCEGVCCNEVMKGWLFLALILILGGALLAWWRVDRYIAELIKVRAIPKPLWSQAYSNLSSDSEGVRGILGRVTPYGIWVWRGWRPHLIMVDDYTVYSYWHACDQERVVEGGEPREIPRSVGRVKAHFAKQTKPGQVISVSFAGGQDWGVASEVHGYDWRVHLPVPLEQQCRD